MNFLLSLTLQIGSALTEDPRLVHFKREWFEGKDCLDIGCNEGYVTINLGMLQIIVNFSSFISNLHVFLVETALRFSVKSMLGVDIDKCEVLSYFSGGGFPFSFL